MHMVACLYCQADASGYCHTGALYALQCSQPLGVKLHLFGFNWNSVHSDAHSIKDEERVFKEAEKEGLIVIHPTGNYCS